MRGTRSDSRSALGRYHLIERLRGGMAEVWHAQLLDDNGVARDVVIKRPLRHLAAELDKEFVSEARLSLRLSHPNLVRALELGEVDGSHFLALEYVHGRELTAVIRALGRRPGARPAPPRADP